MPCCALEGMQKMGNTVRGKLCRNLALAGNDAALRLRLVQKGDTTVRRELDVTCEAQHCT